MIVHCCFSAPPQPHLQVTCKATCWITCFNLLDRIAYQVGHGYQILECFTYNIDGVFHLSRSYCGYLLCQTAFGACLTGSKAVTCARWMLSIFGIAQVLPILNREACLVEEFSTHQPEISVTRVNFIASSVSHPQHALCQWAPNEQSQ